MGDTSKIEQKCCTILAGGDILDYEQIINCFKSHSYIICADSGYKHCVKMNVKPNLLVGDFDSISEPLPDDVEIVTHPPDKDYTDTALACEEAVKRGYNNILLSGITGGRLDHTIANIQTMVGLSEAGVSCFMFDGVNYLLPFSAPICGKELAIYNVDNYYFSVFAATSVCKSVTITGGKYPLNSYDLRVNEARAVSNEFIGEMVFIKMEEGTIIVVMTPLDD